MKQRVRDSKMRLERSTQFRGLTPERDFAFNFLVDYKSLSCHTIQQWKMPACLRASSLSKLHFVFSIFLLKGL